MKPEIAQALKILAGLPARPPLTIVFCDGPYAGVLENWVAWARAAGASNFAVFALDDISASAAGRHGIPSIRLGTVGSHRELWLKRAEIFAAMAAAGTDFIHSDVDAIWLRSPVDEMFDLGTDFVFSPGTVWPHDVFERWGFVLCCGLFSVRAGPATAAFFSDVRARIATEHDDQISVNRHFVSNGLVWETPETAATKRLDGRSFRIFDRPIEGHCARLTVSLLPHRRYPRLPEISSDTVVAHPISPKSAGEKTRELGRLGLWRVH